MLSWFGLWGCVCDCFFVGGCLTSGLACYLGVAFGLLCGWTWGGVFVCPLFVC